MHVAELARLGADVSIEGPSAIVKGGRPLSGAPVMASDLRASAALLIAGMAAKGTTHVNRIYHLDRGYEKIDEKLSRLGARIHRVDQA
jgi:UDP-N-acetylglucosamine 1-carboxyvinyltransferase